ncbi:MAG: RNA polymerase sigma factor [Planctomycetota bacterium]
MSHSIAAPLTHSRTELFVDRHQVGLWRFLRALGCDALHAEEHCQDALLAALHRGIDRLPEREAHRWLRTAARNLFRMQLRKDGRRPKTVSLDLLEAGFGELHGQDPDGGRALQALRSCLRALPGRQRDLIARRYEHGQSRRQIAAAFRLGEAAIKQALRRVRLRLKDCVTRALHGQSHCPDDQETT